MTSSKDAVSFSKDFSIRSCVDKKEFFWRSFSLVALCLVIVPAITAHAAGFACAGSWLFKPDGSQHYVGAGKCKTAKMSGAFACVDGTLYFAEGQSVYAGQNACAAAVLTSHYVCLNGTLTHISGQNWYLGVRCTQVKFWGDTACAGGFFFNAAGQESYVGADGCR
jgi:hypothetical protein